MTEINSISISKRIYRMTNQEKEMSFQRLWSTEADNQNKILNISIIYQCFDFSSIIASTSKKYYRIIVI